MKMTWRLGFDLPKIKNMRGQSKRNLAITDELLAMIPEINPNPISVFDSQGHCLYINSAGKEIAGSSESLFENLGLAGFDGLQQTSDVFWQGRTWSAQCYWSRDLWFCFFSEITALRKAYQQSRYLAGFAEQNPSPVIDLDESGHVVYANQAAEECFSGVRFLGLHHGAFQHLLTEQIKVGKQSVREINYRGTGYMVVANRLNHGWRIYATDVTETQQLKNRLSNARLELVQRLSQASEWRDNETGAHIRRMSAYCRIVAEVLKMGDHYSEQIELAASMHDIGKIAIPDSILHKPGKLTEEEFEIMKQHAEAGGQLLEGADDDLMKMARDIAYFHHERWDGTGYPRKLAAEQIPLSARIASVCDVFDALISERPYKKAWPVEEALRVIKEGSGSQFEPRIVDAFFEGLPRILQLKDEHKDELPSKAAA